MEFLRYLIWKSHYSQSGRTRKRQGLKRLREIERKILFIFIGITDFVVAYFYPNRLP